MRNNVLVLLLLSIFALSACGPETANVNSPTSPKPAATANTTAVATPIPAPSIPKDGDYDVKGVVTKINNELGSIEINHEDVPGLMPPMQMEFFVDDKKMLDGLKVGDKVDFVIRYKHPGETISKIVKAK
jgi:Cu/Ag efflux protein CusF